MSISEVKAIAAEADTDGDGFIDRDEWNAVLSKSASKKAIEDEDEVLSLFSLFDEDSSGVFALLSFCSIASARFELKTPHSLFFFFFLLHRRH